MSKSTFVVRCLELKKKGNGVQILKPHCKRIYWRWKSTTQRLYLLVSTSYIPNSTTHSPINHTQTSSTTSLLLYSTLITRPNSNPNIAYTRPFLLFHNSIFFFFITNSSIYINNPSSICLLWIHEQHWKGWVKL